jgi:hypothetical protein
MHVACFGKTLLLHLNFYIRLKDKAYVLLGLQADWMAKLSDLGFSKGIIVETLVSTYGANGKPNAAPMGVVMEDEQRIIINLFNSSTSCKNIKENKCAVVNLTGNIEVFYKTAFKDANPDGELPKEWFKKASALNAPRLRLAEASIEVSVKELVPVGAEKTLAIFLVNSIQATRKYPKVYCRAMSQTLEAIIHATRVKALVNNPAQQKSVGHLLEMIADCDKVVNRVAPNSSYTLVMADLMKKVNSWEEQK